ncbi:peptidase [Streptomyces sp. uw30]|nr:peptidase [Streptomyces sp. uw30]
MTRPVILALLAVAPLAFLTACTQKGGGSVDADNSGPIAVRAADDACEPSQTSAPDGAITFEVTNEGSKITEFYLYSPDKKVVSEVEVIGPGTSRTMTVKVTQAGAYTTACKRGMVGDGIGGEFTVTAKKG